MDLAAAWHALLGPEELHPESCLRFAAALRERKLTFGDRVHCPFLRPFLLTEADEQRIRAAAETLATAGERVVEAAMASPTLLGALGMNEAEISLASIDPGYGTSSTSSRLDAFLLPDSLQFAEYNAESPAGLGYTQRLAELFDTLPVMDRFRQGHAVRYHRTIDNMLAALLASYAEWGGRATPPTIAIVDWREVPTWTEFEILQDAFSRAGVPTVISDPRDLEFDGKTLTSAGQKIDMVYRRVLINDILAKPDECRTLVDAYRARAVCVANTFRCKLAHKKAFFAVLTDSRHADLFSRAENDAIRAHIPWTRLVADAGTEREGRQAGLLEVARAGREQLVLKPNDEYGGTGVLLGWEASGSEWDDALQRALSDPPGTWVVQERIKVSREVLPQFDAAGQVTMKDMLVDVAPYLFRGRMGGYLTRLSATGLANVTSGGGQVPAFVVSASST
ncbi:MAG: circularly permuted type 2 ATP-grasp protein [Vicinamibacterales bacterium]